MRGLLSACFGAALSVFSQSASASTILYNVDLGSGADSVVGEITTDGLTGSNLSASDIVSFNLQITSAGETANISSSSGGVVQINNDKTFTATKSGLFYNFSSSSNGNIIFYSFAGGFNDVCFNDKSQSCSDNISAIGLTVGDQDLGINIIPETGNFEFAAISAVPEPSTWAMMIIGFAGIGALLYTRRKSEPPIGMLIGAQIRFLS